MQTVWLILLIIFAGVEGITAGLVSVWFCAGSLVALIATWLGAGLPVQIALFVVVSFGGDGAGAADGPEMGPAQDGQD